MKHKKKKSNLSRSSKKKSKKQKDKDYIEISLEHDEITREYSDDEDGCIYCQPDKYSPHAGDSNDLSGATDSMQ